MPAIQQIENTMFFMNNASAVKSFFSVCYS